MSKIKLKLKEIYNICYFLLLVHRSLSENSHDVTNFVDRTLLRHPMSSASYPPNPIIDAYSLSSVENTYVKASTDQKVIGSSLDKQLIGSPSETSFIRASSSRTDFLTSPKSQTFLHSSNILSPPTTPIKLAPESGHFRPESADFRCDSDHFRRLQSNFKYATNPEPKASQPQSTILSQNSKTEIEDFKMSDFEELSPSSRDSSSPISVTDDHVQEPAIEYLNTKDCHKRFGCPYPDCDYKSNRKNNLQRHKETMHSARAVAFSCCSRRFYRRADFDRHKAEEHSQGYACSKCDKHFERRATLARHERSHDKDTPFW